MSFTCISCQVLFANSELQREHHKSDWHRYNLKRKIANLPPVTAESFKIRILSQREEDTDCSQENQSCEFCHKSFNTRNAYNNHLNSKRHQQNVDKSKTLNGSKSGKIRVGKSSSKKPCQSNTISREVNKDSEEMDDDSSEWSSCDEDEEMVEVNIGECLFCDMECKDLDSNVEHMMTDHSFFIPDIEYLVDLSGLIRYLEWKVMVGKQCLWCGSKRSRFQTNIAVKRHMTDKGHCKLLTDDDKILEYSDFYDYSASYPDGQENMDDENEVSIPELEGDDWQLVLPSGSVVGHRSLNVYYKQNIPPKKQAQKSINRFVSQYKALGWTGMTGQAAVKKARDIKFIEKIRNKSMLKRGIKNNKLLQTHFRNQVMF